MFDGHMYSYRPSLLPHTVFMQCTLSGGGVVGVIYFNHSPDVPRSDLPLTEKAASHMVCVC